MEIPKPNAHDVADTLSNLKASGMTIAEAIKASTQLFSMGLGEAKTLVSSDPAWMPVAEAAAPLQEELIKAFEDVASASVRRE
jgi:ribosomal protein L7/L12